MSKLVHDFLTHNVKKNGSNKVLKEKNQEITHRELEEKSNQFANYLIDLGIKKNDRVCILMESSINATITVFGIMKTGAIYVPINVKSPISTIEHIVIDTEVALVVIDAKYLNKINELDYIDENNIPLVVNNPDDNIGFKFERLKKYNIELTETKKIISKDIVCIMHTSGTTGKPKGVMCRHENITPFMNYVVDKFNHNENSKSLSRAPISFDPYLTEIVPSLISGGKVYLYKNFVSFRMFLKVLEQEKIKDFSCPPSLMNLFIENKELLKEYDLSNLSELYIGFEYCPIEVVKTLQELLPNVKIIHGYGTTETYAASTFYIIESLSNKWNSIPIGKPIDGTEIFVLNEEMRSIEPGEIGEMVIRGNTVMAGYWKNIEETNKAFRVNPLFPQSNEKVYFTGDLFTIDEEKNYYFIGRRDEQVKINGYRVELPEIQSFIQSLSVVRECSVITMQINGSNRLICYIATKNNSAEELNKVKEDCLKNLIHYKLPQEWYDIKSLPRNLNEKIDKNKLKELYLSNTN